MVVLVVLLNTIKKDTIMPVISTNKLTESEVKNAKPTDTPYKLSDGGGMYLLVKPTGGKYWHFAYRYGGKQKLLALGVYPSVTIKEARQKREAARTLLKEGTDPAQAKKEQKRQAILSAENSFEVLAREWITHKADEWTTTHTDKTLKLLEREAFPILGRYAITDIKPPLILHMVRNIESKGIYVTTSKVFQWCGSVFRYAIATGRAIDDPTIACRGALKTRPVQHMTRISARELPELLANINAYEGDILTRLALRLMALTFVRTSELIGAAWDEINLDKSEWRIPAARMKMGTEHIVPLSRQAVAVLDELAMHTGGKPLLFFTPRSKSQHISNNTVLYALYRMGYHSRMTGHGFRGLASTILNEQGYRADVIEKQLAHVERNEIRAAYNHAQYLPERKAMMQHWSDYLDSLQMDNVITVNFGGIAI